jgi:hypothetical protein
MFQNENEKVIMKAKSQEASKKTRLAATSCSRLGAVRSTIAPAERNDNFPTSLTSPHNLAPTIEERAMGFFFSNLIISVFGPSQDYLAYILPLQ